MALIARLSLLPGGDLADFALPAAGAGTLLSSMARLVQQEVPAWQPPWLYRRSLAVGGSGGVLCRSLRGVPLLPDGPAGCAASPSTSFRLVSADGTARGRCLGRARRRGRDRRCRQSARTGPLPRRPSRIEHAGRRPHAKARRRRRAVPVLARPVLRDRFLRPGPSGLRAAGSPRRPGSPDDVRRRAARAP